MPACRARPLTSGLLPLLLPALLTACVPGRPDAAKATATPTPAATSSPLGRAGQLGGGVAGTIVAAGAGAITVHDRSTDRDVRVTFDPGVSVTSRAGAASTADLKPGVTVLVRGQAGADGVVRATGILIAPISPGQ